jgi:hypothetical protein
MTAGQDWEEDSDCQHQRGAALREALEIEGGWCDESQRKDQEMNAVNVMSVAATHEALPDPTIAPDRNAVATELAEELL